MEKRQRKKGANQLVSLQFISVFPQQLAAQLSIELEALHRKCRKGEYRGGEQ